MAKTKSIPDKIVDAALTLATQKRWDLITFTEIAEQAKISREDMRDLFADKIDILVAYGRRIDKKVLANLSEPDMGENEKDRIFEVLMERFDVINQDRDALISILNSFKSDPKTALISLPHIKHSMAWMLDAAGIHTHGLKGIGYIVGITGVYLNTLKTWKKDDSADLSKTMATLDKSLNQFGKLKNAIKF